MNALMMASLIWLGDIETKADTYWRFRREFDVEKLRKEMVILELACAGDYEVYLNGVRVPMTQFPDFPDKKSYASKDVTKYLREGRNCLAVSVHHIGRSFFTHYACDPGLMASMWHGRTHLLVSDKTWKGSEDPCYTQGKGNLLTVQLGFTFEYDARKEDDWKLVGYDDSKWANTVELSRPTASGHWARLEPRPIKDLMETDAGGVKMVWQGWRTMIDGVPFNGFRFLQDAFEPPSEYKGEAARRKPILYPGGEVWRFKRPSQAGMGLSCILDVGKESTGYVEIDVEASAGTLIELHHGEHLEDGQVRSIIGSRSFIDKYTCREGRNRFSYALRRYGGRYLQLVFKGYGDVLPGLRYAGWNNVTYPLPEASEFVTEDRLLTRVREMALNTLVCCMHDHYEDCPWREQSLYAYDSRNQMLYGYYIWGNYAFAQASLELLGRSYLGNGYLEICAPAQSSITIPSFTLVWIPMLYEHYMFSGTLEQYKRQADVVDKILTTALTRKSSVPGLYEPGNTPDIWNFYEWIGQLNRSPEFPDSLYNIYLYESLGAGAELAEANGQADKAAHWRAVRDELGATIEKTFWDEKASCYGFLMPEKHPNQAHYEHVQAVMLFNELVPERKHAQFFKVLMSNTLVPTTYSSLPYLVRAMMKYSRETRTFVDERLRKEFDHWALEGFTSLPETPAGPDDFSWAGSCCHGWSAIPAYFANAITLGIRPLKPGFEKFEVKPYPGILKQASGSVPTPYGPIHVEWKYLIDGLHICVSHPKATRPTVKNFREFSLANIEYISY